MVISTDQQHTLDTATTWRIDPAETRVTFTVHQHLPFLKRLTITGRTVVGRFSDVAGTIRLDARRPATARVGITIGAASVDSGLPKRDAQLRSVAFFDVVHHPTLTFTSRMIEETDRAGGHFRVMGDLTIRGVTRAVRLDLQLATEQDAGGQPRLVVAAQTVLNRRDYGLDGNGALLRVADDVAVALAITARPEEATSGCADHAGTRWASGAHLTGGWHELS